MQVNTLLVSFSFYVLDQVCGKDEAIMNSKNLMLWYMFFINVLVGDVDPGAYRGKRRRLVTIMEVIHSI